MISRTLQAEQCNVPGGVKVRLGPAGIHFFNRRTGLNILLDEVALSSKLWAPAPRFVSIALTNACDLACPYCYAPKDSAQLDADDVKRWITELDANGCLGIGFGGGEPTLYRRLTELCRFAARETRLAVSMTTHAHRLDRSLLTSLAGNLHLIRISMDGLGSTYELLRGRPFDKLRQRLDQLRGVVPFGINYVVNARTFPDLEAATEMASALGASEFLILPEQATAHRPGIEAETISALQHWVRSYRGPLRLSVSQAGADGLPICDPLAAEHGLRAYGFIGATGVLQFSSFDRDGERIGIDGVMQAVRALRARSSEVDNV